MRSSPAPVSTDGLGSGTSVPSALPVELHEHEIPDLEESPARRPRRTPRARTRRSAPSTRRAPRETPIVASARGRRRSPSTDRTGRCRPSARSCPCRPAVDARRRAARRSPARARAPRRPTWCTVTRRAAPGSSPSSSRHELPREGDRVALEVVAEGEVAEHLEEGVVPRGVAHLLEIVVLAAGAHALLRRRRARPNGARLGPEEDLLELHHPRVGEQQGRIVAGTSDELGRIVWPFRSKYSRNRRRISEAFMGDVRSRSSRSGPLQCTGRTGRCVRFDRVGREAIQYRRSSTRCEVGRSVGARRVAAAPCPAVGSRVKNYARRARGRAPSGDVRGRQAAPRRARARRPSR